MSDFSSGYEATGSAAHTSSTSDLVTSSEDPFVTTPLSNNHHPHRFSNFGTHLFALNPSTSPSQAKRALEAHLAETERRIQDAHKLGITLLNQQKDFTDRLKEVEKQQGEGEINPELRQKLLDLEKEYNDVGRESARAFLGPKSRASSGESPFPPEGRGPASPSTFSSQATNSPSKLNVPSRKQRNQPSSRIHDIEFATEISTSLLSQVRHLQALLAERDESIKAINLENSRLEVEAEGFAQRIRALDESEQRYKDENWSLETQTHELLAQVKAGSDREQKLTQTLSAASAEKSAVQRELDELKQFNGKLHEDHASSQKHYELELSGLRRNVTMGEIERASLQRKVEDLNTQNEELAKAVAGRFRHEDASLQNELDLENVDRLAEHTTPDNSPPPSPTKGTPRHSMLESETLKSSLHHAHRMIQNLKGNFHRERTEKLELKRMLQEARDELEVRRGDGGLGAIPGSAGKRTKTKSDKDLFKKPAKPTLLGAGRNARSEVVLDEAGWEDHLVEDPPRHLVPPKAVGAGASTGTWTTTESSDAFETANDDVSDAFETANEREGTVTESDSFQTVAESLGGESSDELTETESGPVKGGNLRAKRSQNLTMTKPRPRDAYGSTASTSADDDDEFDLRTPIQPQQQRLRLKINRGAAYRRSRVGSDIGLFNSSPSSARNSPGFISNGSQAVPGGQSLFAELENMGGEDSDEEEMLEGTPSKTGGVSYASTPASMSGTTRYAQLGNASTPTPIRNVEMTDSSMMTDPWQHSPMPVTPVEQTAGVFVGGAAIGALAASQESLPREISITSTVETADAACQWHEEAAPPVETLHVGTQSDLPLPREMADMAVQHDPDMGETWLHPPGPILVNRHTQTSADSRENETREDHVVGSVPSVITPAEKPVNLNLSSIGSQHTEPIEPPVPQIEIAPLALSAIQSLYTEPEPIPVGEEPLSEPSLVAVQAPTSLGFSPMEVQQVEPVIPISPEPSSGGLVDEKSEKNIPDKQAESRGFIGSVFGWGKARSTGQPEIVEDDSNSQPTQAPSNRVNDGKQPFKDISNNVGQRDIQNKKNPTPGGKQVVDMADQSSQTSVSWDFFENLSRQEKWKKLGLVSDDGQTITPPLKTRRSQDSVGSIGRAKARMAEPGSNCIGDGPPPRSPKRPGSSSSVRSSSAHPPLPPDHKQAIAAAVQRVSSDIGPGLMGPPLVPASALNKNPQLRPRTPTAVQYSPGSRNGTTPRPRFSSTGGRSEVASPVPTRRSSVSSFASELNQRFNIGTDGLPLAQEMNGGTDPRMIQAITQTMIGEYLWKYTRRPGRGEQSSNRHRRFFWVHPYTRTLYWSDRDPQSGGKAELKAKSVAIEAVRVITDDNPMPPGLHRKSLVIITPGRTIKFTATTGQRHETWFNALSYLLLRTGTETGPAGPDDAITSEDVEEFNPGYGQLRPGPASLSSYNSRTTRMTSPHRVPSSMSNRRAGAASAASYQHQPGPPQGSISRLSNMFRPSSYSSRRSRHSEKSASVYEASEVHDSAEDLREIIERQDREADKLENVRACCDGKHDVGSLVKKGRYSSQASRYSQHTHDHHHHEQASSAN